MPRFVPALPAGWRRWLLVIALGLLAALPFLSTHMVRTEDGYNYSLSLADAVTQARAGVFPLVGQSVYAFNGRVHPLRTAPYLHYLAIALDTLTLRSLGFGALQNATLAVSLLLAACSCFWALRWGAEADPDVAVLLSGLYVLSPPLMAAAYSFDLFMTVHVATFLPIALAGCVRACRRPSGAADLLMAAGMAGAWYAHAPVAFWLSVGLALVRGVNLLGRFSWRSAGSAAGAALVFLALAAFALASGSTFDTGPSYFSGPRTPWTGLAAHILENIRRAFPAALLPVGRNPNTIADMQLGYGAWLLAGLVVVAAALTLRSRERAARPERLLLLAIAAWIMTLAALALPLPGLTGWLWMNLPAPLLAVTNEWPMYRLYLVALGFVLVGAGLVLREPVLGGRLPLRCAKQVLAVALLWTVYEAHGFIARGFGDQLNPFLTRVLHLPTNTDLTVYSYAFLAGGVDYYGSGVIDPTMEFRIVREGTAQEISLFQSVHDASAPVQRLSLVGRADGQAALTEGLEKLQLQPGRRYLLSFAFATAPIDAEVRLLGESVIRQYALNPPATSLGFGMGVTQRRGFVVWTDAAQAEAVSLSAIVRQGASFAPGQKFADVELREIDPARLPLRVSSLVPLRFDVVTPSAGWLVESPRQFIPGYEAIVNGKTVDPFAAADRRVALRVPAGLSHVELRYVGVPALRITLWVSGAAWILFLAWLAGLAPPHPLTRGLGRCGATSVVWVGSRPRLALGLALGLGAVGAAAWTIGRANAATQAIGPMKLMLRFPYGRSGRFEPLYSSGVEGQATILAVHYVDATHVQLAVDVWGIGLYQSPLLDCDYAQIQSVVVSETALYPLSSPTILALPPSLRAALRNEVRVSFNGRTVILAPTRAYESTLDELYVGLTHFGSNSEPLFQGQILAHSRLPVPLTIAADAATGVELTVRFPGDVPRGQEPLLQIEAAGVSRLLYATYAGDHRVALGVLDETGQAMEPPQVIARASGTYTLRVQLAALSGQPMRLSGTINGEPLFRALAVGGAHFPARFTSGINPAGRNPAVGDFFTGRQLELRALAPDAAPRQGEIEAKLPAGLTGHAQPLQAIGGGLFFVTYSDAMHVQLGFVSAGGVRQLSAPQAVDYARAHEFALRPASSAPNPAPGAAEALLDDGVVATWAEAGFAAGADAGSTGRNPAGTPSIEAAFTGTIRSLDRARVQELPAARP